MRKLLLLFVPLLGMACNGGSDESWARAVQITDESQLIGGPTARGKEGDFLLENDKVRFIVAGKGQSWMGGVFGGSLIDADRRRTWGEFQYGKGLDSFAETFPLVNLLVANPERDGANLFLKDGKIQAALLPAGIEVFADGADGGPAIIRVTGRVGYMFETIKFLNKDFLLKFLAQPLDLASFGIPLKLPVDQLLTMFLKVNVYALINRLQLDFTFQNDYVLEPGKEYLTIRTTITSAPPSEAMMAHCPEAKACDKTEKECPEGLAVREVEYPIPDQTTPTPGKALCPICECAAGPQPMATLNESEDIFRIILGGLEAWRDPKWGGGLLGGDFLFFGAEADIFTPGLGFDEDKKIFENMWQKVPTLANPLTFPWVAGVGHAVSYGWTTKNPDLAEGLAACLAANPTFRLAMVKLDYAQEAEVIKILAEKLGFTENEAAARARHVIVDRKPLILGEFSREEKATEWEDLEDWLDSAGSAPAEVELAEQLRQAASGTTIQVAGEVPENPAVVEAGTLFPAGVDLSLVLPLACQDSKVLIPIFSTSATAVMTHKGEPVMDVAGGTPKDLQRKWTFERYLMVGEGDVGSMLRIAWDLKGVPYGKVSGLVLDEEIQTPISHASVFLVRDPATAAGAAEEQVPPATYDELIARNVEAFGDLGIVSQMQTDRGVDQVLDGNYSGPAQPGSYYLVAFTAARGVSKPVRVEVSAGGAEIAHLLLPPEGRVHYRVVDEMGQRVPCRLTFTTLDTRELEKGKTELVPARWELRNRTELGGPRYDHGIALVEHSASGEGTLELAPGRYEVRISRGFEYGLNYLPKFEVEGGKTAMLDAALVREVNTAGYISGDFHAHAVASIDSSLSQETRVSAMAAEGVEFVTSTDHDYLSDWRPVVNSLGLQSFVNTAVGVETTSLEFGHYNGFPLEYDNTDLPAHGPQPWYGLLLEVVWQGLRDMLQDGVSPEASIVQVNHPRDGFMGYFSQLGMRGYDLERDTPAMEMCNPQTEKIPCNFDSVELMNEKRFELLRTPTVAEKEMHNRCFGEIMDATHKGQFSADEAADDWAPTDALICQGLRDAPEDKKCDENAEALKTTKAEGFELAKLQSLADHCKWREEFAAGIADCTAPMSLVQCKRQALDALKLLTVRYMLERTPGEQASYFAATPETEVDNLEDAMAGCSPTLDDEGALLGACGDCSCQSCVCELHPECCLAPDPEDPAAAGNGWDEECAQTCDEECFGCGQQPFLSKQQVLEDWFSFLNHGFNVTGVGNSDTHDVKAEVGLPRNYIPSGTDKPQVLDQEEIFRNIKEHRVIVSTGPFLYFDLNGAQIGETLDRPEGEKLSAHIRVQTASWFGVDHIEIYRNGLIEKIIRLQPDKETLVDFDETVGLEKPAEDSWYVAMAYGLDSEYLLSPVYKQIPLGKMLIPTIMAMGVQSILISFQSLLDEVQGQMPGIDVDSMIKGFLQTEELPDSFPMFPLAITNPIWVNVEGDSFTPPDGVDKDGDGSWDPPPFCSQPCKVATDPAAGGEEPVYLQSTCGLNQLCIPEADGADQGTCQIPIMPDCLRSQTAASP
jgi:hypothetical protein